MTIDAKELREAIATMQRIQSSLRADLQQDLGKLIAASSAYAATLPREVPVEGWAVVRPNGSVWGLYEQEHAAADVRNAHRDYQLVRLTGIVTLPPREKD